MLLFYDNYQVIKIVQRIYLAIIAQKLYAFFGFCIFIATNGI